MKGPQRIVCLSTETCEVLYRLGQQERIAGISGFTVHPPQARKDKPRGSAFTSARADRILALKLGRVIGSWRGERFRPAQLHGLIRRWDQRPC